MRTKFIIASLLLFLASCQSKEKINTSNNPEMQIESFASNDPMFSPLPLRVGTQGSIYYHRPYSQRAQESLAKYGPSKRINYYTLDEIKLSRKEPAPASDPKDNFAGIFECPSDPIDFANNDKTCSFTRQQSVVPAIPVGKVVCAWSGYYLICVPQNNCQSSNDSPIITNANTPVDVDVLYFNARPVGIGDANGDAEITEQDLIFFDACLNSGSNNKNCVNCFDYDNNGIVDAHDREILVSQIGTGNKSWITQNYPTAREIKQRAIPLRVGIIGSNLYHLPNCPAVIKSKSTYGDAKYLEFYSREEVQSSGRTPDNAGTQSPPSFVQSAGLQSSGSVSSIESSFARNVTKGNLIVVGVALSSGEILASQISDTQGNSYSLAAYQSSVGNSPSVAIFYTNAKLTGSCKVRFDPRDNYMDIAISEFKSSKGFNFETSGINNGNNQSPTTSYASQNSGVTVSIISHNGSSRPLNEPTAFSLIFEDEDGMDEAFSMSYKINSPGLQNTVWSIGGSGVEWSCATATFKMVPGSATGCNAELQSWE